MTSYQIEPMPDQVDGEALALLARAEVASIGHWRQWGFCDPAIQLRVPGRRVVGTAVTLALPLQDNGLLHHALEKLRPGDVLLIDRLGDRQFACWGGALSRVARTVNFAGAVIDGLTTDPAEMAEAGFPVWSRGNSGRTCTPCNQGGRMNVPVSVGNVVVMPGDAVLCDDAGVLVLSPAEVRAEAQRALDHQDRTEAMIRRIERGEKLADITPRRI